MAHFMTQPVIEGQKQKCILAPFWIKYLLGAMSFLSNFFQMIARYRDSLWRLAFIIVISLFAAKIVNTFIGYKYFPLELPQRAAGSGSSNFNTAEQAVNIQQILSRNIFDSEARRRIAENRGSNLQTGQISPSTLSAELLGTMVFHRSRYSAALIRDRGTNRAEYYSIGQSLQGATIAKIERFRVIVDNNGRLESLDLKGAENKLEAKIKTSGPAGSPAEIQEVSPTQKVIPQSVLDDVLQNFSKVLTQARMIPNITDDNKTDGFKIFQIKADSIYEKLGLKDNDIIKRVNGQDLDNFEKATGLFTALRNEKTISIDIVRGGNKMSYTFDIR